MKNILLELTNIVQGAALIKAPADQVKLIVDSISQVIDVEVCSLYILGQDKESILLASHGLKNAGKVRIPPGAGLVGLVAQTRHPVNIANAAKHPNYYFVEKAEEERYKSFCGVPLVRLGEIIGVLVVQSTRARRLSEEKEAFLVTLASHLSILISDISLQAGNSTQNVRRLVGIKGASGIGIGVVQLCDSYELDDASDTEVEDTETSLVILHRLLKKVRTEIKSEQDALNKNVSDSVAGIFESHQSLLSDKELIRKIEDEIRAGHSLTSALKLSFRYFTELFKAMEDPYLRARNEDIRHLGNKLYAAWRGEYQKTPREVPNRPFILVGTQVSVSDIAKAPAEFLAGIVSKEGSTLSHVAVLANALGIPAVMGIAELNQIENSTQLIVDGNEGQLFIDPPDALINEYKSLLNKRHVLEEKLKHLKDEPAVTLDGERVKLYTNTGLLADITPGINNGAEGIGLYRTEIPFIIRDSFPTEEEQYRVYQQVFEAYANKPVYMRTLDVGGDKQLPYFPIFNEANPALGWRGIRFSLDNIQLQMTQVRAMLRAAEGASNLHILLPMVSATEEIDTFKTLLADACTQLNEEGLSVSVPKLGIMLEVPAVISQLQFWADKIDFISIGSNDLGQYLLALDRNNVHVASRYDHLHPAILAEIERAIGIARQHGIPLNFCGEMASDPEAVLLLIGMGIRTLSMAANKLPRIKWLIQSVSIDVAQAAAEQALRMDSASLIRSFTRGKIDELGLGELL